MNISIREYKVDFKDKVAVPCPEMLRCSEDKDGDYFGMKLNCGIMKF